MIKSSYISDRVRKYRGILSIGRFRRKLEGEKDRMRKGKGILLAGLLMLSMSTSVYADKSVKRELPQESTDYYMTVDSGGIGVDIYPETNDKSEKLNNKTVEDGTVLHIEGETEKNGETWGYAEYNGTHGYVPLDELRPSTENELKASEVGNGTDSISEKDDADVSDSDTDSVTAKAAAESSDSDKDSTTKENTAETSVAGTDSDTEKDTTETSAASSDSSIKETTEEEAEPTDSKPVNGTAAKSFKEDRAWYGNPFVWIGAATVLAVLGILGYHLRKH